MVHIIRVVTMRQHENYRTICPRCGVDVTAAFTPSVAPPHGKAPWKATAAWTVTHAEPLCRGEILDQINWSCEDIDWTACAEGPLILRIQRRW